MFTMRKSLTALVLTLCTFTTSFADVQVVKSRASSTSGIVDTTGAEPTSTPSPSATPCKRSIGVVNNISSPRASDVTGKITVVVGNKFYEVSVPNGLASFDFEGSGNISASATILVDGSKGLVYARNSEGDLVRPRIAISGATSDGQYLGDSTVLGRVGGAEGAKPGGTYSGSVTSNTGDYSCDHSPIYITLSAAYTDPTKGEVVVSYTAPTSDPFADAPTVFAFVNGEKKEVSRTGQTIFLVPITENVTNSYPVTWTVKLLGQDIPWEFTACSPGFGDSSNCTVQLTDSERRGSAHIELTNTCTYSVAVKTSEVGGTGTFSGGTVPGIWDRKNVTFPYGPEKKICLAAPTTVSLDRTRTCFDTSASSSDKQISLVYPLNINWAYDECRSGALPSPWLANGQILNGAVDETCAYRPSSGELHGHVNSYEATLGVQKYSFATTRQDGFDMLVVRSIAYEGPRFNAGNGILSKLNCQTAHEFAKCLATGQPAVSPSTGDRVWDCVNAIFGPTPKMAWNRGYYEIAPPTTTTTTKPRGATTTTKPAPVTTKPAPVTTKPAPVTTKPAPVTTKPAPVTTKPAPVTTKPRGATTTMKPAPTTKTTRPSSQNRP